MTQINTDLQSLCLDAFVAKRIKRMVTLSYQHQELTWT